MRLKQSAIGVLVGVLLVACNGGVTTATPTGMLEITNPCFDFALISNESFGEVEVAPNETRSLTLQPGTYRVYAHTLKGKTYLWKILITSNEPTFMVLHCTQPGGSK